MNKPPCAVRDCPKTSRTVKPGPCSMHAERIRLHGSPDVVLPRFGRDPLEEETLPVEPLVEFVGERDLPFAQSEQLRHAVQRGNVSIAALDEIAVLGLRVHPAIIYPEEWFV